MKHEIIEIYNTNKNYYKKHLLPSHKQFLKSICEWTENLTEQLYCLRFNITVRPKCEYSKCNEFANFKGMTLGYGVGGCCRKHGQFISNIKKYGVEMPFQSKNIHKKIKETCIKKYGMDNPMKVSSIAIKVSNTRKMFTIEQKEHYLKKRAETWLNIYGVENIFENVAYIEEKVLEKYGVRNVAQCVDIALKKDAHPKSKYYDYIWKDGRQSRLQGYEYIVLNELEQKGYTFDDIKTSKSDMPKIWYNGEDNKKHRYYPDFFIPQQNIIIEVKSPYTLNYNYSTNMLKAKAALDMGFDFKLEVRTKK